MVAEENHMVLMRALRMFPVAALACLFSAGAFAQAPPGPIAPSQTADPSSSHVPPPAIARKPLGGHPDISGSWVLNQADSDDPREKIRAARDDSGNGSNRHGGWGGGHGGYPGGGGGNGPWGGHGGGNGGGGSNGGGMHRGQDSDDQGGNNSADDLAKLKVAQTATSAVVTSASGVILANYSAPVAPAGAGAAAPAASTSTTSSSASAPSGNSDPSSASTSKSSTPPPAQWQGSQFMTVTQETAGAKTKTTRTYELTSDSQLEVTTKLEGPRFKKAAVYVLYYDAVAAESAGSQ